MTPEFVPGVHVVQDVSPATWLADTRLEHGVLRNYVPTGFEAYVQVFHPAYRAGGGTVRWHEIADWLEEPLLPGVWFEDIKERARTHAGDRPWMDAPEEGQVPHEVLDLLIPALAAHTRAERGWSCLWDGWGHLTGSMVAVRWSPDGPQAGAASFHALPALSPQIAKGPKVHLPWRDYFLLEGPLEAVSELQVPVTWRPERRRTVERLTPSLWWPDDRAWCAGNEVDASFTCIGGDRALIDELHAHPGLEVLELDPSRLGSPQANVSQDDG